VFVMDLTASASSLPTEVVDSSRRRGRARYARSQRAPAVKGYPVDCQGAPVDLTMA